MLKFVVREHHAAHLHYDFRLHMGGVLKSWAIPKGPSMNSTERRLAIRVDDPLIAHGEFAGIIPEGRYGAGAVVIWDTSSFEPLDDPEAALANGRLSFRLKGKWLTGEFALASLGGKGDRKLCHPGKDVVTTEVMKRRRASVSPPVPWQDFCKSAHRYPAAGG